MGRHAARFWGVALAVVLLTPVGAGAIIGGTVDETDRYSNVGIVVEYDRGTPVDICTGTLIAESVVVTAAHCLVDRLEYAVSFERSVDFSADERSFPVREYRINDKYDVALLFLAQRATGIEPAELPAERALDGYRKGDVFTHVGFGVDQWARRRSGSNAVTGFTRRTLNSPMSRLGKALIFTNNPEGSICVGDSGGPIFNDDDVIVALGNYVANARCQGANSGPRLDIAPVRSFLSANGVSLPN